MLDIIENRIDGSVKKLRGSHFLCIRLSNTKKIGWHNSLFYVPFHR